MAKHPYPTLADLHSLMHHARKAVVDLRGNLMVGMKPDLACGFALAALESWRLACRPPGNRDPL